MLQVTDDSGYVSTPLCARQQSASEVDRYCDGESDWETEDDGSDDESDFEYIPPEESDDEVNMLELEDDDGLTETCSDISDFPPVPSNIKHFIKLMGGKISFSPR